MSAPFRNRSVSGLAPPRVTFCAIATQTPFTGVHTLLEVTHRLMVLEALQKGLITGGQPARKLKEQPEIIKGLREYNQSVQQIPRMRIRVRTITSAIVRASEAIRVQEGLMTNDSVTMALMRKMGLTDVATADADFNNISHIRVYQPGDIP